MTGSTAAMPFTVANVICRYNSGSGGPPRTVSAIAAAGIGVWNAALFTTDYVETEADTLLLSEFTGRVVLLDRRAQTFLGGLQLASGLSARCHAELSREAPPDLLHLHGMWSFFLAGFASAARKLRIPYIVAPHGMLEPWPMSVHPHRKALALRSFQGTILREAAAIHATSEAEAANLKALGVTEAPIFVIPNSIDIPPDIAVPQAGRTDERPAGARKVLLFLSRVHPKKGLDMLLEAWAGLAVADWELRIVGHGEADYLEALQRYCLARGLKNVRFHSHVDGAEREAAFAAASAFVLPTYSENFGNVVGEAMIRGLPVITTTGTPWAAIAEHDLGWYVEPTLPALKAALTELFATSTESLTAMGARGRDYVQRHLLTDAVRPRLLAMYQTALRPSVAAR